MGQWLMFHRTPAEYIIPRSIDPFYILHRNNPTWHLTSRIVCPDTCPHSAVELKNQAIGLGSFDDSTPFGTRFFMQDFQIVESRPRKIGIEMSGLCQAISRSRESWGLACRASHLPTRRRFSIISRRRLLCPKPRSIPI